jgi:hypothetical protein
MAQYDVWAVNPTSDDAYFRASATIAASGSIALLKTNVGQYGTGYKVSITSNGADANKTFTITGVKVGAEGYDGIVTETVTGPSASVVYSTNYYTSINSISVSAASAGGVKIGYGGDLAFPRTRIKQVLYVATGTAGSITFTAQPNNTVILKLFTPADGTANDAMVPPEGILTTKSNSGRGDIAVLTLDQVSKVTVICG